MIRRGPADWKTCHPDKGEPMPFDSIVFCPPVRRQPTADGACFFDGQTGREIYWSSPRDANPVRAVSAFRSLVPPVLLTSFTASIDIVLSIALHMS